MKQIAEKMELYTLKMIGTVSVIMLLNPKKGGVTDFICST